MTNDPMRGTLAENLLNAEIARLKTIIERTLPILRQVAAAKQADGFLAGEILRDLDPPPPQKLFRIVGWQSLISGIVDGETMADGLTEEEAQLRFIQLYQDFKGAVGWQMRIVPNEFKPNGE